MDVLLAEPQRSKRYHTAYPPLGLLKLATYHRRLGNQIKLVRGFEENAFKPDQIFITSLFTYAWEPVHEAIRFYRKLYPKAKITVGGIYATLCPEKVEEEFGQSVRIQHGIIPELDDLLPDYSLVPEWDATIMFSSRGCIRKCSFCSVPILEPEYTARESIMDLTYPEHRRIIFWDNNILASSHWCNIFDELAELHLPVDFNQGLDARLLTQEVVTRMRRFPVPLVRLAYDSAGIRKPLKKAIDLLIENGYNGRRIVVYCLYNHKDSPQDFFERVRDLLDWGVVAYPMRYEPLRAEAKNTYVDPEWSSEELEMVQHARRVLGSGGTFPPYEGLVKKFHRAKSFQQAFKLRPA